VSQKCATVAAAAGVCVLGGPCTAASITIDRSHQPSTAAAVTFLSVQCYAGTEYIACVCVSGCVCPSHSLSARLQVRPLNGFDSLKDADLRKGVPSGGLDDEKSHLGVQSPPKPPFWGPE